MNKLPLGIYTFDKVRNGSFLYIDKTKIIYDLIKITEPILLTRPKRFGKTLLLSTIKKIFQGQKNLFKGLWLYNQHYNWPCYPIIHLDMAKVNCRDLTSFRQTLVTQLTRQIKAANLKVKGEDPVGIFHSFITDLKIAYQQQVVVLIDEYDLPIIHNIITYPQELAQLWEELVTFYGVLEVSKEDLRFVFITGVNRFERQSFFPILSSLRDITFEPKFAGICGVSEAEFDSRFPPYLEVVMSTMEAEDPMMGKPSYNKLRASLWDWYGGYSWDGKTKLINLFFLLHFFRAKELNNFWHTTKTPTKLINLIRKHEQALNLFGQDLRLKPEESYLAPHNLLPVPVLLQNGYLSVSKASKHLSHTVFNLSFPNCSTRWLLFIYMMAKAFNGKAGHLWTEIDQLLRSIRNQNPTVTAMAFKRLLTSLRYRADYSIQFYYRQIFLYTMSILGQLTLVDEQNGQTFINGLIKVNEKTFIALQMSHHKLDLHLSAVEADEYDGDNHALDIDDEWRFPSKEILAYEEQLTGQAEDSLARLDKYEFVIKCKLKDCQLIKMALVVHNSSVLKVLFKRD
ncbi:MAG: AAA family ATPase [Deltaproteobacteria bacterium]|jgi:hypothetical protein|nr:AAA family ATPase [Deltaproteobacteria bacterium]